MKPIGKITHYYDKIGVAIIELKEKIKVGDKIKIEGGKNEFDQTIESMEIDRKPVDSAGPGDAVGIKTKEKTKEGALVLKIEE
jgi:translation elongation factor EF-Tu-like GTPase